MSESPLDHLRKSTQCSSFWHYDRQEKWFKKEIMYDVNEYAITEFILDSGFIAKPVISEGTQLDFFCVYQHKNKEEFACHLKIGNLKKVVFAENLPSLFCLLE